MQVLVVGVLDCSLNGREPLGLFEVAEVHADPLLSDESVEAQGHGVEDVADGLHCI